jgi:hypothetical protein
VIEQCFDREAQDGEQNVCYQCMLLSNLSTSTPWQAIFWFGRCLLLASFWLAAHQAGQGLRLGLPAPWGHWSLPSNVPPPQILMPNPFSVRKPQTTKILHHHTPSCFLHPFGFRPSPSRWVDPGLRLLCDIKSSRLLSTSSSFFLSPLSASVPARWPSEDRIPFPHLVLLASCLGRP